jgi:hypothetical protein
MPKSATPEGQPLLLTIAGYQVLAYKDPHGIRVWSWKHPTRVDAGVFVEYEIEDADQELRSRRFRTIRELQDAVLQILPPR